jgi:glycosyltransferase involved in cell wall biosynthesis
MRKELTVALVVKNVERDIKAIIDTLLEQDCPREKYEILVVDTGSTDGTLSILERYGNKIRLVKTSATTGKGRFMALQHAEGKIVAFIDGDVYPPRDFVSKILKAFRDESVICANWPSISYPDKGFLYTCMEAFWDGPSALSVHPTKDGLWPGYRTGRYKR